MYYNQKLCLSDHTYGRQRFFVGDGDGLCATKPICGWLKQDDGKWYVQYEHYGKLRPIDTNRIVRVERMGAWGRCDRLVYQHPLYHTDPSRTEAVKAKYLLELVGQ